MVHFNLMAVIVAALVTMPVGFIWYSPKVFGNAWMKEIGVTDPESMKEGVSMAKVFGTTILLSFFLSTGMLQVCVHQFGLTSILQGLKVTETSSVELLLDGNQVDWLNRFRTFKHGALHGFLGSIFYALPVLGINAMFERRSYKYIFIHAGYWAISMTIMGGILSAWM